MYSKTSHNIAISVTPYYLESQSDPEEAHYAWAYHVKIENLGERTVQLLNRHWIITDASGRVQDVQGAGVVGEQPVIEPGANHEYTSGTVLPTSSGLMGGAYQMMDVENKELFDAAIPTFSLDSPDQLERPN